LAAHGVEIPFVFHRLLSEPGREITGPDAAADLATEMNEAWVSFVKCGGPNWPKFEKGNRRIRQFGNGDAVRKDVVGPEIEVWESVL
jgi:carboxylesterase type B